ncbi:MAG: FdrA family protein, partial [Planctomycetota bacterium]|nr:FdrA family protein [Planctomycetota bacterium]
VIVEAETGDAAAAAALEGKKALFDRKKTAGGGRQAPPKNIHEAVETHPGLNLAMISVAGRFAVREVRRALDENLHVMLFSNNVNVEDELECKRIAHKKGLLLMGPDCGTAIINNVGLCFANQIRHGDIGLAAASGTGLQEVTSLIDRLGGGVTQAIGVGGRDLSEAIGGIMMLDAIRALKDDAATRVVVLISKPPAGEVAEKVLRAARGCGKPVVICFIGGGGESDGNLEFAGSLEDAAVRAVRLSGGGSTGCGELFPYPANRIAEEAARLAGSQKYIRALYCGGTLAAEAETVMRESCPGVYSNISRKPGHRLADPLKSIQNSVIDLGDGQFTQGRPHPMIDPTIRLERIIQEAGDPETAVLLLDFEIGYGSHPDPVGVTLDGIRKAKRIASEQGRHLIVVAYVLGTGDDYQGLAGQEKMLEYEDVVVCRSNHRAVEAAVGALKAAGGAA